jgi:predicted ArsR family transcriptional regulator
MHVSVVRRHMEQLAAAGLIERRSQRAGRGRPHAVYTPTQEGRELFYARYDLLLESITRVLDNGAKGDAGRRTFTEAARVLAKELGAPKSLTATLPILHEVGFQPAVRRANGETLVASRNCPVLKVAKKHPTLICDTFHTQLLSELLGTPEVMIGPTISRGAPECIHFLRGPKGRRRRVTGRSLD